MNHLSAPTPVCSIPVLVKGTGHVDDEFYPIYDVNECFANHNNNNSNTMHNSDSDSDCYCDENKNNKNNKINILQDIDFLNNDNDLYDDNDDIQHEKQNIKYYNISNKSENQALNKYNIHSSQLPYFIKANDFVLNDNDNDNDNAHLLWVKGSKCSSVEKAKDTIIYNVKNELNIGDHIQFELHNNWVCQYTKGMGIVIAKNWNSINIELHGTNTGLVKLHFCSYNIIRLNKASKLYEIRSMDEIHLKTTGLINICQFKIDWLTAYTILSFLESDWQRNVYFNTTEFVKSVKNRYFRVNYGTKSCPRCTFLNAADNIQCSMCQNVFDSNFVSEKCYLHNISYQHNIAQLAIRDHPTFPDNKQRHEMYAKKPYLPKILETQRNNIDIIQKTLKIVLKASTKLYGYQLHTICWAYNLEKSVSAQQKLCIGSNDLLFTNNPNIKCPIYCMNYNNDHKYNKPLFIPAEIKRILPPRLLSYQGGIIADDVGLGKTLTMLSLCLSHTATKNKIIIGKNGNSLKCASTLLIAPSHLIEQWKNEIIKHFKPNIFDEQNIIMITTASEHRKISYSDILSCSIVLVSAEFISGTHYQCIITASDTDWQNFLNPSLPQKPAHMESISLRYRRNTRSSKKNSSVKYQDLDQRAPCLHSFEWRRIILDEGHEYIGKEKIRDVIFNITSDFCWYVTGTPFTGNDIIGYVADFLDIRFVAAAGMNINDDLAQYYEYVDWREQLNKPLGYVLHSVIYNHLFSRHTKDSILDDNYLPDVDENVEYVEFHPIERLFYDIVCSRRGSKQQNIRLERRICSGVLTHFERESFYNNLMELLNINCIHYPQQIKSLKIEFEGESKILLIYDKFYNKVQKKKKEFHEKFKGRKFVLSDAFPNERTEKYQRIGQKLRTQQRRIKKIKNEIARNEKEYEMIKNNKINNKINEYNHTFMQNISNKKEAKLLLNIVEEYGAKHACLLKFVKRLHSDINNRIIIFSLFGKTLNDIQKRLKQINIISVLCVGNVHIRKKAIKLFQDYGNNKKNNKREDGRVILLSIESAASGSNLNKATHIILVDPVPGSSSESFAAERQAIGRAVRQGMKDKKATKVIRFVVKNTIEAETYERNKNLRNKSSNNVLQQLSLENKLKTSLETERSPSEIEFYVNIKENKNDNNKENKKNVLSKKRKYVDDIDSNNILNDDEPPKKKRKINSRK